MSDHDDEELAVLRATLDQATAGVGEMARLFGAYYKALINESVPPAVAAEMATAYQCLILAQDDEE